MGDQEVYAPAARQESRLASYTIKRLEAAEVHGDARNFIYSKWLRSLRYENDFFRLIASDAYWKHYNANVQRIMQGAATRVLMAVLTEDPDVILGFSVFRDNLLDYVYVHRHQRRLGIGTRLVPPDIDTITHLTKSGLSIWGTKYGQWRFNPFA